MLERVLDALKVGSDYDLFMTKECQTLFDVIASVMGKINVVLKTKRPDVVLIHGDAGYFYTNVRLSIMPATKERFEWMAP